MPAAAASLTLKVVDAQGAPLPAAVAFLESVDRAGSRPNSAAGGSAKRIDIAQIDKRFVPEVVVVPVGTAVSFPNRDTVRHHVYSFSPTKRFEIKLYVGTPAAPVIFDQPGIAVLGCNIHDQMAAWVVVVDSPWYGQSDALGSIRLEQVTPGTYRLRVWHNSLPAGAVPTEQTIVVRDAPLALQVTLREARP